MNATDIPILRTDRRSARNVQVACDAHWRACRNRCPSIVVFRGRAYASIEYDWYTLARDDDETERLALFIERLSGKVSALIDAHGPALHIAKAISATGPAYGEFARIPPALVELFVTAITESVTAALDALPYKARERFRQRQP